MAEPSTFSSTSMRSFQSKDENQNPVENSSIRKTQQVAFNGGDSKVINAPRPSPSSQPLLLQKNERAQKLRKQIRLLHAN